MVSDSLIKLLQLTDPALPIGGFAHSSGLETYVQQKVVRDKATAKVFITNMLKYSLAATDAAFVSLSFDAAMNLDLDNVVRLDQECSAVKLPREIRQGSQKLGIRLVKIFQPLYKNNFLDQYALSIKTKQTPGHYCTGFGLLASMMKINKEDALAGFLYNAAAGMVTNSVKLIPISQHEGQEILFSLHPLIKELAAMAMNPDKELIGLCCPGFDICSMQHERLYTRLYMS